MRVKISYQCFNYSQLNAVLTPLSARKRPLFAETSLKEHAVLKISFLPTTLEVRFQVPERVFTLCILNLTPPVSVMVKLLDGYN